MKFDMPKALFSGLALIAAAIYFGPGSQPVGAYHTNETGGPQKVQIFDRLEHCVGVKDTKYGYNNRLFTTGG